MKKEVYYFSGTGNSLVVAREIADRIKAMLIPIPSVMDQDQIFISAKTMGIVFPSYLAALSGMPLIVARFVRQIANLDSLNIFAVCTCGGYEIVNALPSLNKLERIVKSCGGTVSSAYSVRLPMNNLDYDHIPVPIEKDSDVILRKSRQKIDGICHEIVSGAETKHKAAKKLFLFLIDPMFRLMKQPIISTLREKARVPADSESDYSKLIPLTDQSILVDETCIGCGICEKVCPVNNIKIVDRRPSFQHRCEMCFSCDEWCPADAIHHWSRSNGVKYHHPKISLSDMLNQRRV